MNRTILFAFVTMAALFLSPLQAQRSDEAVEVKVEDIESTPYGVSLTLRAARSGEQLRMLIGLSEGEAIARALSHRTPPRPMTHDLMKAILDRTGWQVQRVLIRGIRGTTFLADLVLEKNGEVQTMDARPSDAMAIAVRSEAKIFVNPEVFEIQRQQEPQPEPQPRSRPSKEENLHL